ncbi:hypothetical protein WICMUC_001336 [Wickerhamomyces mucosus]|uniref:Uncharacterized protein n=1 Tax=Wickerhamomyces mucosus TaxID=1378264 RepID=A0A9P8PV79_9ASCO|nr:hypothetical protein WICMUC_001336 [Wickerhamomyces mucosus]
MIMIAKYNIPNNTIKTHTLHTSTIGLYDSLFQILSLLKEQLSIKQNSLVVDSIKKYSLLINDSIDHNEVLTQIKSNLKKLKPLFDSTIYQNLLECLVKIEELDNISIKPDSYKYLSTSLMKPGFQLDFIDYEFENLYAKVNDELMRIKLELINWDDDTEVEDEYWMNQPKVTETDHGNEKIESYSECFELDLEL